MVEKDAEKVGQIWNTEPFLQNRKTKCSLLQLAASSSADNLLLKGGEEEVSQGLNLQGLPGQPGQG